ncbi:ribonuclease domain-containing protein [Kitasatospora sp. NPDC054939]
MAVSRTVRRLAEAAAALVLAASVVPGPAWASPVIGTAAGSTAGTTAAAAGGRAVLEPSWPVEDFPPQVDRACLIWRELGWPTSRRAVDFRIPGPEFIRGSNPYGNRSGDLPAGGAYHEYDVNPRPAPTTHRDAERLVRDEATEQVWYTADHYANFREIGSGC